MPFRLLINLLVNLWILVANVPRIFRVGRGPRWVRIDLKEPLPARPAHRRLFAPRRGSLAGLSTTIDRLLEDERLVGVVFKLDHLRGGWAKAQTVRGLIARLRAGGKKVVVHLSSPGLREYYVACAAESIVCDESGPLTLLGLASEAMFFAAALAKGGVRAETESRGAYKSFAETFTREDMSPANREALDAILDALAADVKRAIAAGRGVDEARAGEIMTGGPYLAADAAARKIIDAACYLDQLPTWLGEKGDRLPSLGAWQAARWRPFRWRPLFVGRRVRVVSLHGGIVGGEGTDFPRRTLGGDAAARVLEGARRDRRVAAVVLHVDSRGGSAAASDRIWRETVRLAGEKPVVAYFDDVAASGGYYLACAATKIVAQPGTLTGSIGVVAGKLNLAGLYERLGIRSVALTRGDAAAMHSAARGFTPDERARLAGEVDALYRQFVGKVAEGRRLSLDAAEAAAQGRVWIGEHARERGLVDELGDVDRAIELARELARERGRGRPGEKLTVEDVHPAPRRRGLLGRLLSSETMELPGPLGELYDLASLSGERAWLVPELFVRWS